MASQVSGKETELFVQKLSAYKKRIDADIASYTKTVQKSILQNYGAQSRIPADAFLELLARGGKRIRGALCMAGYEMMGGTNKEMITQAARALEMIHVYLLIMDDIQDRSESRRGGPAAHVRLSQYHHNEHLSGNSEHFGIALSLNAMGIGNHAAQVIVANLDAPEDLRLKALSILNQTVIITAHGQTSDIMNEVNGEVSLSDVDNVLEWKTAHYTFLNPLTFGMVLAGADCRATDAVREYALNAGRAFQISDDILGTFGSEFESGKSPMDDIKEGKRTLLTVYALEHVDRADKNFLIQMLGNQEITQTEFNRVKDILSETGALAFAENETKKCIDAAVTSIKNQQIDWDQEGVDFLIGLAEYLLLRKN